MDLLGGCKCVICGETELNYLTIDHINNTGYLDKKSGVISHIRYRAIINGKYPREDMLNLRILCWNHNCGRRKEYLDMPWKKQSKSQRHQTKLWKEALDFFGPCSCGNMDLKHLTISHINNDGAERRKGGEKFGSALLTKFRQLGWPESLKEDYCLECFNCNCGRNSIS